MMATELELAPVPAFLLKLAGAPTTTTGSASLLGTDSNGKSGLPVGRDALDFVANGAPVGSQRNRAVAAARNYLGAHYTEEQTIDTIYRGLEASPQDPEKGPWTREHAAKIVRSLAYSTPKPIKQSSQPIRLFQGAQHHADEVGLNGRNGHSTEDNPVFARSDAGNGEYFAHLYGGRLHHDHAHKRWLFWRPDQHRWEPDPVDQVRQLAKQAARRRYREATRIEDLADREKEAKHAIASEARSRMDAMLVQAASEPPIADSGDGWDADPWLLGVANGVIDLRTLTLRPGRPEDKITRQVPIAYDSAALADRWIRFLDEVFAGDEDMIVFVQTAGGYSLTGLTREQCLMLCIGGGANGKSTLLRTLRMIAGPYGHNMPFTALEPSTRNLNDLADLHGKRLVTASESNEATKLNEARVKALTGDDPVTGRQLYERAFEFRPEAKLWLSSNHKPRVADDSHGFWRRIHLVPFTQKFDPHTEPNLEETLRSEAAGILAWAIRGVGLWLEHGLKPPKVVMDATKTYRQEQDVLQAFVDDACAVSPTSSVGAAVLYRHYASWAQREGHSERERMTSTMFGRRMGERFIKKHDRDGWRYSGIGIPERIEVAVTSSEASPKLGVTSLGGGFETSAQTHTHARELLDNPSKPVTEPNSSHPLPAVTLQPGAQTCHGCGRDLDASERAAGGCFDFPDCRKVAS